MAGASVLIITQPPHDGGVPAKTRILCRHLRARGCRVTVAWYATFGHDGDLNSPLWRALAGARPSTRRQSCLGDFEGVAVGCWAPELEAPYYLPSAAWRALIAAHDRHIAVGGPPMVGNLLAATGTPGLLWCASDVLADRQDRIAAMSPPRRLVHDAITLPWLARVQRRVLHGLPLVLGVSHYTTARLAGCGCPPDRLDRLPIPVDGAVFRPAPQPSVAGVIGFAARFEDPRKNLPLALEAVARLRAQGLPARLRLAGAQPSMATRARVERLNLAEAVEFVGDLSAEALAAFYRSLDVFVIPSHQEGLCIAGLEAMASGVPVVATRCGGPEDYVRDGATGALVEPDAHALAGALARVIDDRALRARLAEGARAVAAEEYSPAAFAAGVARAWQRVWGEAP